MAFLLLFTKAAFAHGLFGDCPGDFYPSPGIWLCPDPKEYVTCCTASWKVACDIACHEKICTDAGGWWIPVDTSKYGYTCELKKTDTRVGSRLGTDLKGAAAKATTPATATTPAKATTPCLAGQAVERIVLETSAALGNLVKLEDQIRNELPWSSTEMRLDFHEIEQTTAIARDMLKIFSQQIAGQSCVLCASVENFVKQVLAKVDADIDKVFNDEIMAEAKKAIASIMSGFESLCSNKQGPTSSSKAVNGGSTSSTNPMNGGSTYSTNPGNGGSTSTSNPGNGGSASSSKAVNGTPSKVVNGTPASSSKAVNGTQKLGHSASSGCPVWLPQAQAQRSPGSLGYVCKNAGKICSYPSYAMTFKCDEDEMVWKEQRGVCPSYMDYSYEGAPCNSDQQGLRCSYYGRGTFLCDLGRWEALTY